MMLTPFADVVGWTLIHFAWQGVAIAVPIALLLRLAEHRSARLRYVIACAGLAAMLAAPIMTAVQITNRLSSVDAVARVARVGSPESRATSLRATSPEARATSPRATIPRATSPESRATSSIDRVLRGITLAWLLGVVLLLARMAGGWRRVDQLHRAALKTPASRWQSASRVLAERLAVPAAHVVESALVEVPTVIGWIRPVILLPVAVLAMLTPAQVEAILAHELAHVRRHDYLVNLLQTLAETLLFYHPAAWWLSRRIRIEREHCCDDVAIEACGDAVGYAGALATLEAGRLTATSMALAATGGSLIGRVRRILSVPGPEARRPSWAVTLALTLLFTAGAGGVQLLPPPAPPAFEVSSTGRWQMGWGDGSMRLDVNMYGTVTFRDDLTDVLRMSDGGTLTIRDWSSYIPHTVEIRAAGGELTRSYYVAGFARPWSDDARLELAQALPQLVLHAGFGAESRVKSIYARGGASGVNDVLTEIDRLQSDYARRLYFSALLDVAHLDAAAIVPVLSRVNDLIRSDYERGQVLRRVADRVPLDRPAATAYVQVTASMRSDYERRRALNALLSARPAAPGVGDLVVKSAVDMRSDYERSQLLQHALDTSPIVQNDSMFDAVGTMRSSYEKRRVLMNAISRPMPSVDTKRGALAAAATIQSDYERGAVLQAYARAFGVESGVRQVFFGALDTMRSDYERRRVLTLVANSRVARDVEESALQSVASMRSDYERAEVLLAFLRTGFDPANRQAFVAAADRMRSSHDQNRVLAALVRSERR